MHARPRLLAVAAVVGMLLTWAPAPAGADSHAVRPDNRPTPAEGHENGRLPDSELITVEAGCRVARAAGPSLRLLLDTAHAEGVRIGTRSCYRNIDGQVAVQRTWTARGNSACAATPRYDADGRPIGTSTHGWGKAVDFSDPTGPMTFSSPGFRWLSTNAGRFGWNHPDWARPGGGPCPEPWHFEWVGDGGTLGGQPVHADVVALLPSNGDTGYLLVTGLGEVRRHGAATFRGSAHDLPLGWVVVDARATPTGNGYHLVAADGGVFTFGDARFHGSTGDLRLNRPIVSMASTASNRGYWLAADDGGVFTFGDARFHGSTGDLRLNRPIVGMERTASVYRSGTGGADTDEGADGYWLVAADGGVFTFGDARFHGSAGNLPLASPVVGMAATTSGRGYWLAAADGGVFTFGDAAFHGSAAGLPLAQPIVGVVPTISGRGYWLVAADGGVFAFGDARWHQRR